MPSIFLSTFAIFVYCWHQDLAPWQPGQRTCENYYLCSPPNLITWNEGLPKKWRTTARVYLLLPSLVLPRATYRVRLPVVTITKLSPFFFWCSLSTAGSKLSNKEVPYSVQLLLCSISTWSLHGVCIIVIYMWSLIWYFVGGYVFITNMIPLHALVLVLMGRFSDRLYVAYSTWYAIGTLASMQVPFVGFQPVSTSEHMGALGIEFFLVCAMIT